MKPIYFLEDQPVRCPPLTRGNHGARLELCENIQIGLNTQREFYLPNNPDLLLI